MTTSSSSPKMSLDYWRGFFRGSNANIFDAIEAAILIAASDFPDDLRARRDSIAERLFTCLLPPPPAAQAPLPPSREGAGSVPSLCSSDRPGTATEAVTVETEALESRVVDEVLKIKDALLNDQDMSDEVLFELLKRLQEMEFTVDTLTVTEIGKAVSRCKKHNSKQIRHLVRTLIEGWKALVDEWVTAKTAIVDHTPQSTNPASSVEQGELLLSPLDNGALFATPSTSIRFSEFSDGMDDDGNITNSSELDKQWEVARRNPVNQEQVRRQHFSEPVMRQSRQQCMTVTQGKPSNAESWPGRSQRLVPEQKSDVPVVQRRPQLAPIDTSVNCAENSVRAKLEIAKRKLQEGYQQAENAKKQRTIQVMELQEIPKQGNQNRQQPSTKPRNHIRSWTNGRR